MKRVFTVRTATGLTFGFFLLCYCVAACTLPTSARETPDFKVGDFHLNRHPTQALYYLLSVAVYNGSDRVLHAFQMEATASIEDDADTGGEAISVTQISLSRRCTVIPGASPHLELEFVTPFPFVPPTGLTLTDIRLHSFLIDDGSTVAGEIHYPYTVKEK